MNTLGNNKVQIAGEILSPFMFHHEVFGEGFYQSEVSAQRLSGVKDIIPVTVSERLIDVTQDYTGKGVMISGQFRSYDRHDGKKNRLMLSVFAREISFGESRSMDNKIELDGYICMAPVHRKTPHGREITDIMLAVNRRYGKTDYIPCIVWGRNAVYASSLGKGTHVHLCGRIQSREYVKKHDGGMETRTAYEVSANGINAAI